MARKFSLQAYVPAHVSDWVNAEAARCQTSRSEWVGSMLTDLYGGQELRTASQKQMDLMARRLVWLSVAVDGLLADSRDPGLREQVHAAYHRKLKRIAAGDGE